nr:hypothetical protein BaRGS_025681 [Batillaria attramentaria]
MAEDLKLISENPKPTCKLSISSLIEIEKRASSETTDEEAEEARRKAIEEENARQNALWAERDRLGHELWQAKKEQEERDRKRKEEIETSSSDVS